jgi:hypothetical protein
MQQPHVFALAIALTGCATARPTHTVLSTQTATETIAQSLARTSTPVPTFCVVDGREASCRDVLRMVSSQVESVEVLDGRTAAAAYGERANAGVLVVATKR